MRAFLGLSLIPSGMLAQHLAAEQHFNKMITLYAAAWFIL